MSGQERLGIIAFSVSICVIILLALIFSLLFFLYSKYKSKNIKNGHEDEIIKESYFKKCVYKKKRRSNKNDSNIDELIENEVNSNELIETSNITSLSSNNSNEIICKKINIETININEVDVRDSDNDNNDNSSLINLDNEELIGEENNINNKENYKKIKECIIKEKRVNTILNNVIDSIFLVIGIFFLLIFIFSFTYRINNETIYFNNKSYITIYTDSMERKYKDNDYLDKFGLDNQILQYSLIELEKVDDELKDMKLYDIYAFKDSNDDLIIHRLIEIKEDKDDLDKDGNKSELLYTFRGDSNFASLVSEVNLYFEDIEARYTGFNNYGLGITLIYLKSGIGLISLASAFFFLVSFSYSEYLINNSYTKRIPLIFDFNEEEKDLYFNKKKRNKENKEEVNGVNEINEINNEENIEEIIENEEIKEKEEFKN